MVGCACYLSTGEAATGTSLVLAGWPASLAKSASLKPVKDWSQIRRWTAPEEWHESWHLASIYTGTNTCTHTDPTPADPDGFNENSPTGWCVSVLDPPLVGYLGKIRNCDLVTWQWAAGGEIWGFKRLEPFTVCSLCLLLGDQEVGFQLFCYYAFAPPLTDSSPLKP